jgi:hypothetical protein
MDGQERGEAQGVADTPPPKKKVETREMSFGSLNSLTQNALVFG